ncbi:hypothetical protein C8R47DRAFT_1324639 [Mycena vitilis]|nr:hypothetical protein C8R47DRAFT_1324639 [Mycena vitilis]
MAQGHSNMRKCVSNEFRCPKVPGPMLPILITGKPKALNLPGFTLHLTAASSSFVVVNSNAYLQCIEFISFKACLGFTRTFLRKYDSHWLLNTETIVNLDQLRPPGLSHTRSDLCIHIQVIRTPSTYVLRLVFSRPHRRLQFGPGLERRDYLQIVLGAILLFDIDTKPLVLVDRCVCVVSLVVIFETRIQCFGSYTYLQPNWTFRGQGKTQPRLDANSNINSQPASFSLKFLSLSLALPSARLAFIPASSSSPIELRLESKVTANVRDSTRHPITPTFYSISFKDIVLSPSQAQTPLVHAGPSQSRPSPPRLRSPQSTFNPATSNIHHPTLTPATPQPHTTRSLISTLNPQPPSCIPTAEGLKDTMEIGVGVGD